jgi:hypothetical protein
LEWTVDCESVADVVAEDLICSKDKDIVYTNVS